MNCLQQKQSESHLPLYSPLSQHITHLKWCCSQEKQANLEDKCPQIPSTHALSPPPCVTVAGVL